MTAPVYDPALYHFQNTLRRLKWLEPHLVGLSGAEAAKFEQSPLEYLIRCDHATATKIWGAIQDTPAAFIHRAAIPMAARTYGTGYDMMDRIEELEALLLEAREDLAAYVESDYPEASRAQYPDIQRRWHRDMELCRRIDALIAQEGEG